MTVVEELEPVLGTVKWFDVERGFGFIACDALDGDILLHLNVLRNFGLGSVADGAGLRLCVQATDRGYQATELIELLPAPGSDARPIAEMAEIDPEDIAVLPLQPARVKWFNRSKGFGFANVFGKSQDVFIHADVVRSSGMITLQPGEAVGLRVAEGPRGLMAVMLEPWDASVL